MFLDGNVLRIALLLLSQLLWRQLSNYETLSISLVIMNAQKQLCFYLYVPKYKCKCKLKVVTLWYVVVLT